MSQEHTDSGTRPGPVFGEPGQPLHALDRRGLHFEIHGLIDRDSASWEYPGVLRSIELAGRYLTGDWTPPREPEGRQAAMRAIRVSRGAWLEFVGRTGALALHAVSPLTPTPHRERLLAWLDMWAESPFAARPTALRWGVARTELDCARDERGATLAVAQEYHGRRRFVELRTGEAKEIAATGDFEGVLSSGVGIDGRAPFRVLRLTGPGRIAVDVATS